MATAQQATLDDLYTTPGKAELIAGRIVPLMPTGKLPNRIAGRIYARLLAYEMQAKNGCAYTDNIGYTVPILPSGRESFSPDTSYFLGVDQAEEMRFVEGPPTFAVEVRSENDYGPAADAEYSAKRRDYFTAGTLVVWDVDPLGETITAYRADPDQPHAVFRRGDVADAEPAVPGWRIAVDDTFATR